MKKSRKLTIACLVILLTAGCATSRTGRQVPLKEPNPARSTTEVPTRNSTVEHFVRTAREQFRNNQLNASEETINRGLNIAPENPVLWHLLAKIRFLEGNYTESETFASRSINYTGNNRKLTNQNWRLIAHARKKMGDLPGVNDALSRIREEQSDRGWFFW